ncbi:hypothetical protein GLA29479_391 [Lysobacter antibioticus]|nr:hypothetical protein GLA29479_391 [Lysobacter antibioticus]
MTARQSDPGNPGMIRAGKGESGEVMCGNPKSVLRHCVRDY